MGAKYTISQNARCPHYRSEQRDDPYKIRCDGPAIGSWIHMVFADRNALNDWRDTKCKGCWKDCPIAKMLEK